MQGDASLGSDLLASQLGPDLTKLEDFMTLEFMSFTGIWVKDALLFTSGPSKITSFSPSTLFMPTSQHVLCLGTPRLACPLSDSQTKIVPFHLLDWVAA